MTLHSFLVTARPLHYRPLKREARNVLGRQWEGRAVTKQNVIRVGGAMRRKGIARFFVTTQ